MDKSEQYDKVARLLMGWEDRGDGWCIALRDSPRALLVMPVEDWHPDTDPTQAMILAKTLRQIGLECADEDASQWAG